MKRLVFTKEKRINVFFFSQFPILCTNGKEKNQRTGRFILFVYLHLPQVAWTGTEGERESHLTSVESPVTPLFQSMQHTANANVQTE